MQTGIPCSKQLEYTQYNGGCYQEIFVSCLLRDFEDAGVNTMWPHVIY